MKKLSLFILLVLVALNVCQAFAQGLKPPPRYRLQPGDTLSLDLRLSPEYDQTVLVQPDGYIDVNLIGEVKVSALTVDQAHDLLLQRYSQRLNKPELSLVLKDFQRPFVVVGGEVQTPGKIELRQDMTAMQAVILAGGFRGSARDTRIVVFRHINADVGEVRVINLHKIQRTKDLERDIRLEPGDMILVPANRVETFSRYMQATHFSSAIAASTVP